MKNCFSRLLSSKNSENRAKVLLYTVCRLPSIFTGTYSPLGARRNSFFSTKNSFAFAEEIATSMQILRTAYGKKPVRKTWQTPTIHYSLYVIFLSFPPCFVIVREQCIAGFYNTVASLLEKVNICGL